MSHGLGSHLAMLTITQEAVVLSREGWLESEREREREEFGNEYQNPQHPRGSGYQENEEMMRWDREAGEAENEEEEEELKLGGGPTPGPSSSRNPIRRRCGRFNNRGGYQGEGFSHEPSTATDSDAWVDEVDEEEALPPGQFMSSRATRGAEARVKKQMEALEHEDEEEIGDGSNSTLRASENLPSRHSTTAERFTRSSGIHFPSSAYQQHQNMGPSSSSTTSNQQTSAPISNGLLRVKLVSPEIEIPPLAGMILIAGVSDVIKGYRHESERGIETLSSLRRSVGPNHTACLLHSPAHLLYAAKNILDIGLLPPKFLLIHGGKDSVVPIEQSTLMKTLLTGVGLEHVKLRAYRELGHAESIASLFVGMGKRSTRYSRQILNDVKDFVEDA